MNQAVSPKPSTTTNVIVQFESEEGVPVGSHFDISSDVTPLQLEQLLNKFLKNDQRLPYSFFLEEKPLESTLSAHLTKNGVSVEKALRVVYQPQAVFRVRPVTRCTASLQGHTEAVLNVSFSPDGRQLATGSGDTTVRHWNLDSQTPLHTCKGHRNWVLSVSWSPDGVFVVTGDMNGQIAVWNPAKTEPLGFCKGHRKWITSLAWKPAHLMCPCIHFCSGSKDCTIKIWNVQTRRCEMTLSTQQKVITCVKWGGNGCIYSSSRDTTIAVWDSRSGTLIARLVGHAHWVNTMALSSDYVLRTGPFDSNGNAPGTTEAKQQVALERYQELTNGKAERLVSGSDDHTMILWNPAERNPLVAKLTGHVQLINQVQFSPDGRWFISASFDKSIKVWDGIKGTFYASLFGHVAPVFQVAWSPDSRFFVSGSKDSTLKVWDIKAKKLAEDLPGHADEVYAVDWSPNGAFVASGGKDKAVKIWRH